MPHLYVAAVAFSLGVLIAAPARADRDPTPQERAQIEQVLRDRGFQSWEEVEMEDDGPFWEVDDARTADGREFDLKLRVDTLEIVEWDD